LRSTGDADPELGVGVYQVAEQRQAAYPDSDCRGCGYIRWHQRPTIGVTDIPVRFGHPYPAGITCTCPQAWQPSEDPACDPRSDHLHEPDRSSGSPTRPMDAQTAQFWDCQHSDQHQSSACRSGGYSRAGADRRSLRTVTRNPAVRRAPHPPCRIARSKRSSTSRRRWCCPILSWASATCWSGQIGFPGPLGSSGKIEHVVSGRSAFFQVPGRPWSQAAGEGIRQAARDG